MPTYTYKCAKCGDLRDYTRRISEAIPVLSTPCPRCETTHSLEKQVTSSPFVLKGNGWYKTDFK